MAQNSLIIDAADPNSLALILPSPLGDIVRELPKELLVQDEETLTTLVNPSAQQKRVKIQFWDEYELAIKSERNMLLSNIVFGVCTREYLLEFCQAKRNTAWLVSPRPSYKLRIAELIDRGLDAIEDIFSIKPTSKNLISVRGLQLSALKMIDMRKHGGYTQRQEIKSLSKQVVEHTSAADNTIPIGEGSIEQLEAQVRTLEQQIAGGKNQNGSLLNVSPAEAIDVTPGTVS